MSAPDVPGWRPDPRDPSRERWWDDGIGWTEFTRLSAPSGGRHVPSRRPLAHRLDDATRPLSIIVGSPVWVALLYGIESTAAVPLFIRMQPQDRPLLKLAFFTVMALLLVLFAEWDRRVLKARGFSSPSSLWSLATPIAYLSVRGRTVDGADSGPLVIHLALLGVSVFAVLLGIALGVQQLAA